MLLVRFERAPVVSSHPSAPTTLRSVWRRPRLGKGEAVWSWTSYLLPQRPDCPSHRQSQDPGLVPLSQTSHGASPCPAGSGGAGPRRLLDKLCLALRLEDQPKADMSGDHEVEVSGGDMQAVDGASLSSPPAQHAEGPGEPKTWAVSGQRPPAAAGVGRVPGRKSNAGRREASYLPLLWFLRLK